MKKAIALGNIIFLYLAALLPVLLFTAGKNKVLTFVWEHLFFNNVFVPLGFILLVGLVLYFMNIGFFLMTKNGGWNSQELAKMNMIVKLIQIPAYLFIFVVGLLCGMMIFTIGISFVLLVLDIFSIGMTGIFASCAFYTLKQEQKISGNMQVLYSLASFLFCVDIIIAVVGYRISISENKH